MPKLQISKFWNKLLSRHTSWSCLMRFVNMKWIRRVLLKIQSGHDSVHRWTDGRRDGQGEPVYPAFNFVEAEGITRQALDGYVYDTKYHNCSPKIDGNYHNGMLLIGPPGKRRWDLDQIQNYTYFCLVHAPMCYEEHIVREPFRGPWTMTQRSSPWGACCSVRHNQRRLHTHTKQHGPLTRYVNVWVAHAPGMPGTLSPPPRVSDPDMYHGTCVTHVP